MPGGSECWFEFRTNPKTGVEAGYKERDPGYSHAGDCHGFWELLYVDQGLVRLVVEGVERAISQGEYLLIGPHQRHAVAPSATVALFYITVHFDTNLEQLPELVNTVVRADETDRRLLLELLKEKSSEKFAGRELARCYLAEFLIPVRKRRGGAPTAGLPTYFQANAESQIVEKTLAYLRVRLARPLTLEEISRAAGVSLSHLEHVFKKRTGMPVMTCLQDLRMQNAKKLLLESALNVSQIAERCGYSSVHVFSRRFKKSVSVPPTRYARMVRLGLLAGGGGPAAVAANPEVARLTPPGATPSWRHRDGGAVRRTVRHGHPYHHVIAGRDAGRHLHIDLIQAAKTRRQTGKQHLRRHTPDAHRRDSNGLVDHAAVGRRHRSRG
jgi:AraC-like DNA-binding protein